MSPESDDSGAGRARRLPPFAPSARRRAVAPADDFFTDEEISWEEDGETDVVGRQPGQFFGVGRRSAARDPDQLRTWVVRRRVAVAVAGLALLGLVLGLSLGLTGGANKPAAPILPTNPGTTVTPTVTTPSSTPSLAIAVPAAGKALKLGDRGAAVRALQRALAHLGFVVGTADGLFGAKTRAAVVSFQQAHGLTADGVVGPNTARALNAALSG